MGRLHQMIGAHAPTMKTVTTRGQALTGDMTTMIQRAVRGSTGGSRESPDVGSDVSLTVVELAVPVLRERAGPEDAARLDWSQLGLKAHGRINSWSTD